MVRTPAIAVVGAGIAGLAAGALLAARGMRVTIFEQSPRPGPIGAGLLLQPTGLSVLEHLGLRDVIEGLGAPVHRLHGRNHRGRVVMDLAYADLDPAGARSSPLHGLGVHRGALFSLLHARALTAGARLVSGARITGLSEHGDRWRLLGEVVGADGSPHTDNPLAPEFDLVVVADGARSALRSALVPRARARPYPWGALWFVARDESGAFDDALRQVYRGTRSMVGWLPTGRPAPGEAPTVSVFWSVPVNAMDAARRTEIGVWRREMLRLAPELGPLVGQIVATGDLISAVYMDVDCPLSPRPGVVVLGDAAHATSPQLGQGANLALMDALALAQGLERYPPAVCELVDNTGDSEPAGSSRGARAPGRALAQRDALAAWLVQRRRASIRFYQRASRWMTPWFQSGLSVLAAPRDVLMAPAAKIPWVRRQMLLSLAGVKTGVLRADPLPGVAEQASAPAPDGGAGDPEASVA